MDTPPRKTKLKIYIDPVKLRHTSHWDMDFLSRAEYEALMEEGNRKGKGDDAKPDVEEGEGIGNGDGD